MVKKFRITNGIDKNYKLNGIEGVRLVLESLSDDDLKHFLVELDVMSALAYKVATKNEKQCNIGAVSHELPPRETIKEIAQKYTSTHTDVRKELTKKLMTLVFMDGFYTGHEFSRGNCG